MTPTKEQKDIEKAIKFLVAHISKECRNEKPLILHSLNVGFKAKELGFSHEIVLAGFLHDLVEDTNCQLSEIKKEFGPKVAKVVSALTQLKIKDYKLRWRKYLPKIIKAGKEAMFLKLVDGVANLAYLPLVKDREILKQIFWKINFTVQTFKPIIGDTKIFKDYIKNASVMIKKLNGK